jgi:hypothetical protein
VNELLEEMPITMARELKSHNMEDITDNDWTRTIIEEHYHNV